MYKVINVAGNSRQKLTKRLAEKANEERLEIIQVFFAPGEMFALVNTGKPKAKRRTKRKAKKQGGC